jgi:hypothetical protein
MLGFDKVKFTLIELNLDSKEALFLFTLNQLDTVNDRSRIIKDFYRMAFTIYVKYCRNIQFFYGQLPCHSQKKSEADL